MSLRSEVSVSVKERYHNHAINLLIASLSSDPNPEDRDVLLATVVILRMSEQFSEIYEDACCHLAGAASLFSLKARISRWSSHQTDLAGTAFWIYIRESLRLSFLNEEACQFDLRLIQEEKYFDSAPEEVWTNRMTFILAKVCNACFGELDSTDQRKQFQELDTQLNSWVNCVPKSFRPWWFKKDGFGPFPGIAFLSTWHGEFYR